MTAVSASARFVTALTYMPGRCQAGARPAGTKFGRLKGIPMAGSVVAIDEEHHTETKASYAGLA
jgi:hypothetical protein